MRLFEKLRLRRSVAHLALADSERRRKRIDAQWPEVLERASWARETRQRNHLTELFRGGNS